MLTIYEEIRSLIRQGYKNSEIQDKLMATTSQITYQRNKIKKESVLNW